MANTRTTVGDGMAAVESKGEELTTSAVVDNRKITLRSYIAMFHTFGNFMYVYGRVVRVGICSWAPDVTV